jgi:hypothetical protein
LRVMTLSSITLGDAKLNLPAASADQTSSCSFKHAHATESRWPEDV